MEKGDKEETRWRNWDGGSVTYTLTQFFMPHLKKEPYRHETPSNPLTYVP